jgi:cell division protein FtsA
MSRKVSVGIGIGTYHIKVVVTEDVKGENGEHYPKIIGTGVAESKGLRHGYIINIADTTRCLKQAIANAEKSSGIKIKKAYLGIGGIGLSSVIGKGTAMTHRADSEVTETDVKNALAAAENDLPKSILTNKRIIHSIPVSWKIDNEAVIGRPIGMHGAKLEAKVLFILCIEQHLNDLIEAVENAGIEVVDVMASALAASLVNLSKSQKIAGCILVNIGAETVSLVVYENNVPMSLEVFPVGSADITNDIALGFRIPIDEAEGIKVGRASSSKQEKKKLDEIVTRKLSDIFNLIEAHLKKIGRSSLLPAGIILTGGGSMIETAEDLAKAALKLPSKIAPINIISNIKDGQLKDPSWSVAYGLSIWGLETEDETPISTESFKRSGGIGKSINNLFKKILP